MKKSSKSLEFTPEEKKSLSAYERWELPALLDSEVEAQRKAELALRRQEIIDELNLPTAEEFEQIRKDAYKDGFKEGKKAGLRKGYQQGLKNGQAEIDAVLARLAQIMRVLGQPIPRTDQRIEETLINLVLTFCKQIIGRELIADSQVIGVVIEEIIKIINLEQKIKVFLNPQDADLVVEFLEHKAILDDNWQIIHRDTITPGGCIVDTKESHIEASVEKRIEDLTHNLYRQLRAVDPDQEQEVFSELQGYSSESTEKQDKPSDDVSQAGQEASSTADAQPASKPPTKPQTKPQSESGEADDLSMFESDLASTLEDYKEGDGQAPKATSASEPSLASTDEPDSKPPENEPPSQGTPNH